MDRHDLIIAVKTAIAAHDAEPLRRAVAETASYCCEEDQKDVFGAYDDDVFDFLVGTLRNPAYQALREGWHLLHLFESDWGLFTEPQRGRLLETLAEVYPRFRKDMSFFVMSELLGRFFQNEKALHVLIDLNDTLATQVGKIAESARAHLPLGLNYVARDSNNTALRTRALEELRKMRQDPSENVREEAAAALQALKAKE